MFCWNAGDSHDALMQMVGKVVHVDSLQSSVEGKIISLEADGAIVLELYERTQGPRKVFPGNQNAPVSLTYTIEPADGGAVCVDDAYLVAELSHSDVLEGAFSYTVFEPSDFDQTT